MATKKKSNVGELYERAVAQALHQANAWVTASEIARAIGIHQVTAKKALYKLRGKRKAEMKKRGNRIYFRWV